MANVILSILEELRLSARLLARQRLQASIVIVTLALATGALTSVFSVVSAVMLKSYGPLNTDQWVYLWEQPLNTNSSRRISVSVPNFLDWKRATTSVFSDMVLWLPWSYTASGADVGDPQLIRAAVISPEVFSDAGVAPAAGRFLLPSDSQASERMVVISYELWQSAYGANPSLVGKKINLNLAPHTVAGIAPPGFSFPPETPTDVWTVAPAAVFASKDRAERGYRVAAKLRPGVDAKAAQAALSLVAARLSREYPEDRNYGAAVIPMREAVMGDFRTALIALSGALAFGLALVCLNVAYLRGVHLESRRKEIVLRLALGAKPSRLARQLLIETLLLYGSGAVAGLLLAPVVVRLLISLVPAAEVPWLHVHADPVVFLICFAATLVAGLGAALLPAAKASSAEPALALRSPGAVTNISSAGRCLRNSALAAQIGLALIPLCGAGLLIRSFQHLQQVAPGFDPEHRLTLMVSLPKTRYAGPKEIAGGARRIRDAAANAPGVRRAGMVQALPFAPGLRWLQAVSRDDPKSILNFSALPLVRYTVVTAGYFEAMGIELKSGRLLNDSDVADSQPVVVINERLARDHFAGENPLGRQIWIDHAESLPRSRPRVVVGVVADTRMDRMEAMPDASAWVPIFQQDHSDNIYRNLYLVAQTDLTPASAMAGIRERIHGVDPDLALSNVATMDTRLADSMWRQRFSALVVGALGVAALAIAALGVFGITSYLVACRTYEIGVRMAVGAAPSSVLRMILGQGLAMALVGVCVGLAGAFALTRILSTFLFDVSSTDPLTFAVVALTLIAAAALANYFPARRAAAVDPIVALRME